MPLLTTFTVAKLEPFMEACEAPVISIKLGNSLTLAAGTVLGRKTSDNKWYAYASGNSDGTQVPRAILKYAIATDSSGNAFYGAAASSEFGESVLTVPAYIGGIFAIGDLTGLDANAMAALFARLIFGDAVTDTTDGVIKF